MTTKTAPETVASIELDGGGRGTIRVHQTEAGWVVTCQRPDGQVDDCEITRSSRQEAMEAIRDS